MYYYNTNIDDSCYPIKYWENYMKENNLTELELFKAKIEYGNGFFFCAEFQEVGEISQSDCGKSCEKYQPRNGKNGRCKFSNNTYDFTDEKIILKL